MGQISSQYKPTSSPQYRMFARFSLTFEDNYHVGSGQRSATGERLMARGARQQLTLSGSTLKGNIRDAVHSLSDSLGLQPGLRPHEIGSFQSVQRSASPVARLFGGRGPGNRVNVSSARKRPTPGTAEVLHRHRVQIERKLNTAKSQHLMSYELATGDSWTFDIRCTLPHVLLDDVEMTVPLEFSLLVAGCLAVERIGAMRSCGLGTVVIELENGHWTEPGGDPIAFTSAECLAAIDYCEPDLIELLLEM